MPPNGIAVSKPTPRPAVAGVSSRDRQALLLAGIDAAFATLAVEKEVEVHAVPGTGSGSSSKIASDLEIDLSPRLIDSSEQALQSSIGLSGNLSRGYDKFMNNVEHIEAAVQRLSPEELATFCAWFAEFEAAEWDRRLEADSAEGRLDWLVDEAVAERRAGRCNDL